MFTACATFVLIIAGALVTSNDAGLSIPDWPTSFGSFSVPPLHGGVRFEWSHRAIAGSIVILTISIAAWTAWSDRRRWMKWLGLAALGTVVIQAVLGGLTVLLFQPPWVSSAHALVAQTFFCIAVSIALFTSRAWLEENTAPQVETRRPHLMTLVTLSIVALYVQLFVGAMFRHHGMGWLAHVLNAPLVTLVLSWTAATALLRYPKIASIKRAAIGMLGLLVVQLCLGVAAFLTRIQWGRDAAQPEFPMVVSTVAHVAVGALLLATTVVLAIQVWRHVSVEAAVPVKESARRPLVA